MRDRRIDHEWQHIEKLRAANPARFLPLGRDADNFYITLLATSSLRRRPDTLQSWSASLRSTHSVRIFFPRYYPAMPCEVYVSDGVFHPNAHPDTGFMCLWERHLALHTVGHALTQLVAVLSGRLFNCDERHVMQPDALEFYLRPEVSARLPLPCSPFLAADPQSPAWGPAGFRRRLS